MDADLLPMELRRVQLCKYGTNQPLGLYIRNGRKHLEKIVNDKQYRPLR